MPCLGGSRPFFIEVWCVKEFIHNDTFIVLAVPMSLDNFDILNSTEVNEKCQLRQVNEFCYKRYVSVSTLL